MKDFSNDSILQVAIESIQKAISEKFSSSYGPLSKIVEKVLSDNEEYLKGIISEVLLGVITTPTFKKQLEEEFQRKVAKLLVGKLEGTVEQAVDILRQDQRLRAKMIIAIENIIQDNQPNK